MRPTIIAGTAMTAAVLTMLAAVVGGVVGVNQLSATNGILARSFVVVAALGVTAFAWWMTMRPDDAPEALLVGLCLGWVLNPQSWAGASFFGQLVSDVTLGAALVDLVGWSAVSFLLVLVLTRTSATTPTR